MLHSAWREGDIRRGYGAVNDKGPMAAWLAAAKARSGSLALRQWSLPPTSYGIRVNGAGISVGSPVGNRERRVRIGGVLYSHRLGRKIHDEGHVLGPSPREGRLAVGPQREARRLDVKYLLGRSATLTCG